MSIAFSVLVANKNKYKKGIIQGGWIDLPTTKEKANEILENLKLKKDNLQIVSWKPNQFWKIPDCINDNTDLEEANYFACLIDESFELEDSRKGLAVLEGYGRWSVPHNINLLLNMDKFYYDYFSRNAEELGRNMFNRETKYSVPAHLEWLINYEAYGLDCSEGGHFVDSGYIEQNSKLEDKFKGVPEEYRLFD